AKVTQRIATLLDEIDPPPPPQTPRGDGDTSVINARRRLAEIPGINTESAQLIIAEIGLDMTRFPTAGHLVSWAKLCPRTIQSGTSLTAGKTGKGNPYLKGALGIAAATSARGKGTFLSERYQRLVKRRGKGKAPVAVARSILVIIWHLLTDPTARFQDLGADFHNRRVTTTRKTSSLVRQLEPLGHTAPHHPPAGPTPRPSPTRPTDAGPAPRAQPPPVYRSFPGQTERPTTDHDVVRPSWSEPLLPPQPVTDAA